MSRGEIKHVARAQQINSFKDIQYRKITPTDIDGVIEYQDKAYVFIEVKYMDAPLPFGQRLALRRMVDDAPANKKQALAIVCEHEVHDTDEQIRVADLNVREIYLSNEGEWRPPNRNITVREIIDSYIELIDKLIF